MKSRPASLVTSVNLTGGAAAARDENGNSLEKTKPITIAATASGTRTGTSCEMAPSRGSSFAVARPSAGIVGLDHGGPRRAGPRKQARTAIDLPGDEVKTFSPMNARTM